MHVSRNRTRLVLYVLHRRLSVYIRHDAHFNANVIRHYSRSQQFLERYQHVRFNKAHITHTTTTSRYSRSAEIPESCFMSLYRDVVYIIVGYS